MPAIRRGAGALAAGALVLLAVGGTDAQAARPGEWRYQVTAQVQETGTWSYATHADIGIPGDPCPVDRSAGGTSTTLLRSRRPTRVLVVRGSRGLPSLDVGTGEGVPMVGASVVAGSDVTTHGGSCAGANPTEAAPTTGCGRRTEAGALSVAFRGPDALTASVSDLDDRRDCPTGPPVAVRWPGDDGPSLSGALASVDPDRLAGTRQVTVHGRRTWTGTTSDGAGSGRVTWTWEATYRRIGRG